MALGREALGRGHFRTETAHVAEWDGEVILRGLTAAEQSHIQELATKGVNAKDRTVTNSSSISAMARYAVLYGWIDADGNNVLNKDDAKLLLAEPFAVIQRLSTIVLKLSGMETDVDSDDTSLDLAKKN